MKQTVYYRNRLISTQNESDEIKQKKLAKRRELIKKKHSMNHVYETNTIENAKQIIFNTKQLFGDSNNNSNHYLKEQEYDEDEEEVLVVENDDENENDDEIEGEVSENDDDERSGDDEDSGEENLNNRVIKKKNNSRTNKITLLIDSY